MTKLCYYCAREMDPNDESEFYQLFSAESDENNTFYHKTCDLIDMLGVDFLARCCCYEMQTSCFKYDEKQDGLADYSSEYGDAGLKIEYCPWCATRLPD